MSWRWNWNQDRFCPIFECDSITPFTFGKVGGHRLSGSRNDSTTHEEPEKAAIPESIEWGWPAPGTRSRRALRCSARRDPVPPKAGGCPETATGGRGRSAALATAPPAAPSVASGPDHPRLVRVGRRTAAECNPMGGACRAAARAAPRKRDAPSSVFGRGWVWPWPSWSSARFFAVKGRVRGVGSARLESADLRASTPATLCHAPSRGGRRRGCLGRLRPSPRF